MSVSGRLLLTSHLNPMWCDVSLEKVPNLGYFIVTRKETITQRYENLKSKVSVRSIELFKILFLSILNITKVENRVMITARNQTGTTIGDYTFEFDSTIDTLNFYHYVLPGLQVQNLEKSFGYIPDTSYKR